VTNSQALNSKNIIEEVILREIKAIVYSKDCSSAPYSKFILIATAIEFLGACGDSFEFQKEKQSEDRFNKGLSYFNKKYHQYSKSSSDIYLYEDFRCGLVHQFRPTSKVNLAERGKGYKNLNLTKEPLKLIIVLEDIYDDLEKAAKNFLKLARKGKIPNIPKNSSTFLEVTKVTGTHTNNFMTRTAANIRMLVWLDGSTMNILHCQAASGGDVFN